MQSARSFARAHGVAVALFTASLMACAPKESDRTTADSAVMRDTLNTATASPTAMATPNDQMKTVLDELGALGGKPIVTLTPAEARKQPTPADAVKSLLKKQGKSTAPEAVGSVVNRTITGPGGPIRIRIYTPKGSGPFPVIVYYHGGGWVIADLDVYDATPRALANAANAVVVSSHYRQGPEHKFPAAHDDAYAAYEWTVKNAASIKGDPARVAVVGESAGGNLATAVSLMARDNKAQLPLHQVLIYPIAGYDLNTPSYRENAEAKPLNKAMMAWFYEQYLRSPADGQDPRINLVSADLKGLPPATIITAQIDPLRSDGEMLGKRLRDAGVESDHKNYDGVAHEFFGMAAVVDQAREAQRQAADALKKAFGK